MNPRSGARAHGASRFGLTRVMNASGIGSDVSSQSVEARGGSGEGHVPIGPDEVERAAHESRAPRRSAPREAVQLDAQLVAQLTQLVGCVAVDMDLPTQRRERREVA